MSEENLNPTEGKLPLSRPDTMEIQDAAASIGVELRGEEWHPFHCGVRMRTFVGIIGLDLSRCESCGAELRRIDSPHVNGGYILSEDRLQELGERVWWAIPPSERTGGTER